MTLKPSPAPLLMYLLIILCCAMLFCITSSSSPSFATASLAAPLKSLAASSAPLVGHVAFDAQGHFAPQQDCTPDPSITTFKYYLDAATTDANSIHYQVSIGQTTKITVVCTGQAEENLVVWALMCRGTGTSECGGRIVVPDDVEGSAYPKCTKNASTDRFEWSALLPIEDPAPFQFGIGIYHLYLHAEIGEYSDLDYTYALASDKNCGAGIMRLVPTDCTFPDQSVSDLDFYLPASDNAANGDLVVEAGDTSKVTIVCKNPNAVISAYVCKGTSASPSQETDCVGPLKDIKTDQALKCSLNAATDQYEWTGNYPITNYGIFQKGPGTYYFYLQAGPIVSLTNDYTYETALYSNCKSGIFTWKASQTTFDWALDSSSPCVSPSDAMCDAFQTQTFEYKCRSSSGKFVDDLNCPTTIKPASETSDCTTTVGCDGFGQMCNASAVCVDEPVNSATAIMSVQFVIQLIVFMFIGLIALF